MINIETDILVGILFFIFYLAVRAGIRGHLLTGTAISLLFIYSGFVLTGTDGIILIICGLLLFLITIASRGSEKGDE